MNTFFRARFALGLPLAWLLICLGFAAQAQSPYVQGPSPVCAGSQYLYSIINPTSGLTYLWSVTSNGNIALVAGNTATVTWGLAGSAIVTATGKDNSGATIETLNLPVTVRPLPEPQIIASAPVKCQPLKYTPPDIAPPEFDTSSCLGACVNTPVLYHSPGGFGSSYNWVVNGGTPVIGAPPNHATVTWPLPGKGTVTVTETTVTGCQGSKTICVDVIEGPAAHFVALPDTSIRNIHVCEGSTVMFIDKSTSAGGSPIVSWKWDFGDGSYSSAPGGTMMPVSHTYNTPGHYTVRLIVTNACGCTAEETMEIDVDPGTGVQISCPGVVCFEDMLDYTVNPSCAASSWSVVGGKVMGGATASAITIKWDDPNDGFGYLMYDPSSCPGTCPSATVVKVPIVNPAHPIEGKAVICPDGEYLYRLPQWPSTLFNWTLSGPATLEPTDQPNEIVIKTGNAGGTLSLQCDYENTLLGCQGSTVLNIDVLNPETIQGDKKLCLNTATSNYSLGGGNSGTWTLYDTDHTLIATGTSTIFTAGPFDQVGQYTLTVTGAGYCDPEPMYITVDQLPPAPTDITGPDTMCKGVPVQFAGNPELSSSVLRWGMINGTANSEQGPFSFIKLNTSSTGPFIIQLWRESKELPYCHSDTITKEIDTPFIDPVITGDTTPCMDSYSPYTIDYKDGESYSWRIDKEEMGSVESGQNTPNVNILWNHKPGIARIICDVRKCYGTFSDTLLVDISAPIVPNTVLSGGCNQPPLATCCPQGVFQLALSMNSPAITGSRWDMGDGKPPVTVPGNNIFYSYDNVYGGGGATVPVTYNITYTAFNPSGCPDTLVGTATVTVNKAPLVNITPTSFPCEPALGFSHTLSTNPDLSYPQPQWYEWYHNNTKVAWGPHPAAASYAAIAYGEYYVIAWSNTDGTQGTGCSDTSINKVRIVECGQSGCGLTPAPYVNITYANQDTCGYVHLTATHTSPNWINSTWQVSDPDGVKTAVSTATSADFWFKKPGVYTFTYEGAYSDGQILCKVHDFATIVVPYIPDIDFTAHCAESLGHREVQLDFNGTILAPAFYQYAINSNVFNIGSPYLQYLLPGNYDIGIQVSIPGFPTCTYFEPVTIPDFPQANFVTDRPITCEKEAPVVFTNTSTDAVTAFWDFGDGAQNTQYDPERVYESAVPAIKDVTLIATDSFGCSNTITKPVTIVQDSIVGTTVHSPTNPCEGLPVTLSYAPNLNTNFGTLYKWKANNTIFAIGTSPNTTIFKSGYYWVYTEDQNGCWDEADADTVNIVQVPKVSIFGKHDACVDAEFTLSGYAGSISGASYQWYRDATPLGTQPSITEKISAPGQYQYQVELTILKPGGGSCSRFSPVFTVDVHGSPASPAPSFGVLNCDPYQLQLDVTPQPPGTYYWNKEAWGVPAVVTEGGPYQVVYTDQYGCTADTSLMAPKHPSAYLWMFPSGCYSLCGGASYKVVGPIIPFSKWDYLQGGGSWTTGTGTIPAVIINTAGMYNLQLNNGYCTATSGPMHVDMFGCDPSPKPSSSDDGDNQEPRTREHVSLHMDIVPNPAQNSTRIDFSLPSQAGARGGYAIEVYDALGRKLNSLQPPMQKGSWYLPLDGYAPGVYQVVLREENKVLLQKRLSVIN